MRKVEERVRWKSPGAEIRMMFRFANNAQLDSFPTLPLRQLSTRYSLPMEKKNKDLPAAIAFTWSGVHLLTPKSQQSLAPLHWIGVDHFHWSLCRTVKQLALINA